MTEAWQERLLDWYRAEARQLPWRGLTDPYRVWVSEAMLQQTTVAAVLPYYERWLERFPTVEALAEAAEEDVMAAWAGLGYYRRARNLQAGARHVVREGWPAGAQEWRGLPGVGRYTAGAVASIALGEDAPVVDGNIERVYARFTVDDTAPPRLNGRAWVWAESALVRGRAAEWNQALMELGARVCRPRSPLCGECPLAPECRAREVGTADRLPTRKARPTPRSLNLAVWLVNDQDTLWLRQAGEGEWWTGLWVPPMGEGSIPLGFAGTGLESVGDLKTVVTKHRLTLRVHRGQSRTAPASFHRVPYDQIAERATPAFVSRALKLAEAGQRRIDL